MTNKILGYVLLFLGLAVIIFSAWQSFLIFTGKVSAPLVFVTPASFQQTTQNSGDIQSQISQTVREQLQKIISPDSVTKTFNLVSWSIFAWILIVAGGAVSRIGVKLLNGTK